MVKYKCRQAIHTKIVCEYCDDIGFSIPEEFQHFKLMDDETPIGYHTITNLLTVIENNSNNEYFFLDFLPYLKSRLIPFTKDHIGHSDSKAEMLMNFVGYYNQVSDLKWLIVNGATHSGLVARRGPSELASKYDDLFLYFCANELFTPDLGGNGSITVNLPFERSFYKKNVELFNNVQFDNKHMEIYVNKNEHNHSGINIKHAKKINVIDRVEAAANTISPKELNLKNLSNAIGISPRSLQRELRLINKSPVDVINKVKISAIVTTLNKNQGNIKKTAYDCGYNSLSSFSCFFSRITGKSPSQYLG